MQDQHFLPTFSAVGYRVSNWTNRNGTRVTHVLRCFGPGNGICRIVFVADVMSMYGTFRQYQLLHGDFDEARQGSVWLVSYYYCARWVYAFDFHSHVCLSISHDCSGAVPQQGSEPAFAIVTFLNKKVERGHRSSPWP